MYVCTQSSHVIACKYRKVIQLRSRYSVVSHECCNGYGYSYSHSAVLNWGCPICRHAHHTIPYLRLMAILNMASNDSMSVMAVSVSPCAHEDSSVSINI